MIPNIINLFILAFFGVIFLFVFAKQQENYFLKVSNPQTLASKILYFSSIAASGIIMLHIADAASDANLFFVNNKNFFKSIVFSLGFFGTAWIIAFLLFRFSFLVVGKLTTEDEIDELIKNNLDISILHSIILIILALLISPSLNKIAITFIPYPEMPF